MSSRAKGEGPAFTCCRHLRIACRALILTVVLAAARPGRAQQITAAGHPAQLDIRAAGAHSIRVTLKPVSFTDEFPFTPALAEQRSYPAPTVSLRELTRAIKRRVGNLNVEIRPDPLTVIVTNTIAELVQELVFQRDG